MSAPESGDAMKTSEVLYDGGTPSVPRRAGPWSANSYAMKKPLSLLRFAPNE